MIFKRESTFEEILKKNETYLISESLNFPTIKGSTFDNVYYHVVFSSGHQLWFSHIKTDSRLLDVMYLMYYQSNLLAISNDRNYVI